MPDRRGQADQRFWAGGEVHHPHRGAKIQDQVQNGGGELAVQLLQEHHAAGCVSAGSAGLKPGGTLETGNDVSPPRTLPPPSAG